MQSIKSSVISEANSDPPLTSLQCCPMKKEALFSGAEVVPSSSTWGTEEGNGLGSEYGLSVKTALRWLDMLDREVKELSLEGSSEVQDPWAG